MHNDNMNLMCMGTDLIISEMERYVIMGITKASFMT